MDYVDILSENDNDTNLYMFTRFFCYLYLLASKLFLPIHMRLLRLFISKSDIEDAVISKHLSNQAALITFRMAFGIQSHTLRDAKK